jgi:tetratricopeptide (TPR) repeat protein
MTRLVSPVLAALLAAALALPAAADDAPAAGSFADAVAKFQAADFQKAAEIAEAVEPAHADYARSRYLLGEIALIQGAGLDAEARFREALEKKPESAPVLLGLGRALLAQNDAARATPILEKAAAADPKSARARAFLGLSRTRSGARDAGRKDLDAASKLDPADPEVARAVVEERIEADDLAGAGKAAAAFSKAKKDHPMGAFLQALVLDRSKRWDEAIAGYERAIALDPAFLDAHKNLGIVCIAENPTYEDRAKTKKGLVHLRRYLDLGGRDEEIRRVHATMVEVLAQYGFDVGEGGEKKGDGDGEGK